MDFDKAAIAAIVREDLGAVYDEMRWVSAAEAQEATLERDSRVGSLAPSVQFAFGRSKPHSGAISPGCRICGEGDWSCLFVNQVCNARCFFCPEDQTKKKVPSADDVSFITAADYVDYLGAFDIKGVGYSGGEPFLELDIVCDTTERIRGRFGSEIYVWVYTNGTLATTDKLKRLAAAGLDEIRFDIAATNYRLDKVALALGLVDTVTVEIPAIPEDLEIAKQAILEMDELGVDFLNLHQLIASNHNGRVLTERGYTVAHGRIVGVIESELAALELLDFATSRGLRLPVHYCSNVYQDRYQGRGNRRRAGALVAELYESLTPAGTIRRIGVRGDPEALQRLERQLSSTDGINGLFSYDQGTSTLLLHHSLLEKVDFSCLQLTVTYDVATLKPLSGAVGDAPEARQPWRTTMPIRRSPVVSGLVLTGHDAVALYRDLITREYVSRTPEEFFSPVRSANGRLDPVATQRNARTLVQCDMVEHLEDGLQELF